MTDQVAGPRVFRGIEELRAALGQVIGPGPWHTITQDQVDAFAVATGDHQWIHVDVDRAARGPFGGTIAHGFLTVSLSPKLLWELYTVEGISMGLNYGCNKIRFPSPLRVGSRVRGSVELVDLVPLGSNWQATARMTIEVEGGTKPVCVAELLSVYVP